MTVFIRIKYCCVLFLLFFGDSFEDLPISPLRPLVPNIRRIIPITPAWRLMPVVPIFKPNRCCDEKPSLIQDKSKNLTAFLLGHITQNRLMPEQNALDVLISMATQGSMKYKQTETDAKIHLESKTLSEITSESDGQKALKCAKLECESAELNSGPVCACNFKTGNTVTFKNECDVKKHNCRFDTEFKTIVTEICPWQYESRNGDSEGDSQIYNDLRYYN